MSSPLGGQKERKLESGGAEGKPIPESRFRLSLPERLWERLKAVAGRNHRTTSAEGQIAIEHHVKIYESPRLGRPRKDVAEKEGEG